MNLRLDPDRLRKEIDEISSIITVIKEAIQAIPGDDLNSNDTHIEIFNVRLCSELLLASQRLSILVEVLNG